MKNAVPPVEFDEQFARPLAVPEENDSSRKGLIGLMITNHLAKNYRSALFLLMGITLIIMFFSFLIIYKTIPKESKQDFTEQYQAIDQSHFK